MKRLADIIFETRKAVLDLSALTIIFGLTTYFAVKYKAFDAFVDLSRKHRELSLHDIATGLFVLSGLLLVFSLRRWLEFRMAVAESKVEEQKLRITQAELERRIRQRTEELFHSNENLKKEISERKLAQNQLEHRAYYDPLTDLPNRTLFMNRLKDLFEYKKRYPEFHSAVLFMDVDRFKNINDSMGHLIGDQLLIMIGQRLTRCVRGSDTIARFAGDEFAIIAKGLKNPEDVHEMGQRIKEVMKSPFSIFGQDVFTSLSVGVAHCEMSYYDRQGDLLRDADIAMYRAKEGGGGGYEVFREDMHAQVVMAQQVENDLRKAAEKREFRIYYQPIVRTADDGIAGFEALVRWEHPERGLLLPGEFIHVAEETGIIVPIGNWVLREACRQMKMWRERYPLFKDLSVSVNISNREFVQSMYADMVRDVLDETGLPPECLRLEITERVVVANLEYALLLLKRLKEMGVRLDIDDFGTGHSAFSSLRNFPVDALKIDRTFISALTSDYRNQEIVKAIVKLAHTLDLEVVAEGVETLDQLSLTKGMKCAYVQGFYYYRPMDVASAENLLREKLTV